MSTANTTPSRVLGRVLASPFVPPILALLAVAGAVLLLSFRPEALFLSIYTIYAVVQLRGRRARAGQSFGL